MKPDPSPACAELADTYGVEELLLCEVRAAGFADLAAAGIRTVQDTAAPHETPADIYHSYRPFGFAAEPDAATGNAACQHVTDDPGRAYATLAGCRPLAQGRDAGKYGDLGPGLYCSNVPTAWLSRSRARWSFLEDMTPEQRTALYGALRKNLDDDRRSGRIAAFEHERGIRDLDYWRGGQYGPLSIVSFAGPPYSIQFWRPAYLEPLGIVPGRQPDVVPMQVRGRFAELSGAVASTAAVEAMRRAGLDGAFVRDSVASTPQLVVWDDAAVREFDGLHPDCGPPPP